jgi:hypothetical protein
MATTIRVDRTIWNSRLSESFDEQACLFERQKVAFYSPMLAMEGH